jgi:hypothetical protein
MQVSSTSKIDYKSIVAWFILDIPKSGGTTAKRMYECLGQTLA